MPSLAVSTSTLGDNTLLPAAPGVKYRVRGYVLDAGGAVSVTWKGNAAALSGALPLIAGTPLVAPIGGDNTDPSFWFETAPGDPLVLNLSAGVQVSGHLLYDTVRS